MYALMAPFVASKNNKFLNRMHYLMETSEGGNEKIKCNLKQSNQLVELNSNLLQE